MVWALCHIGEERFTRKGFETRIQGKAQRGRLCKILIEDIRKEMEKRCIEWKDVACNREGWRGKCKKISAK